MKGLYLDIILFSLGTITASMVVTIRLLQTLRPVPHRPTDVMDMSAVKWRTGDIILYHSNAYINTFANGKWSHVGMVCIGVSGVPFVFDLTGTRRVCSIRPLIPEIISELWHGDRVVAFRRITPSPDRRGIKRYIRHLIATKVTYDHLYWRAAFRRIFGWVFPLETEDPAAKINNRSICSSVIVRVLQQNGVVQESIHSFDILPHDFGERIPSRIPLTTKYKWGPVIFLRMLALQQK